MKVWDLRVWNLWDRGDLFLCGSTVILLESTGSAESPFVRTEVLPETVGSLSGSIWTQEDFRGNYELRAKSFLLRTDVMVEVLP